MKNYNKLLSKYNFFDVDWLIGTKCNYNCSYCASYLHDGKHKFVDIKDAKRFLLQLKKEKPNEQIVFIISGGEPTLWKDLPEFMKFAKENQIEIQLVTNGSKPLQWWIDNAKYIDLFVISFHWEYADPEHIKLLCSTLREKFKSHIKVNILVKEDKFKESYDLAESLETIPGILIELRPLRQNHGMYLIKYTDEQMNTLKKKNRFGGFKEKHKYQIMYTDRMELFKPDIAILNKENSWKGWECNVGLENLKVLFGGEVVRGNCDIDKSLGNIHTKVKLPTEPVICNRDFCKCVTDIRTTKKRIEDKI